MELLLHHPNQCDGHHYFVGDDALSMSGVFEDVVNEYSKAKKKHGDMAIDGASSSDFTRLTSLMEEVGEVANALTYDGPSDPDHFRSELIQVAYIALAWASIPAGGAADD